MTESIYTDEMIEACAHACSEAHRATGMRMALPLMQPWGAMDPEWQDVRRADARDALAGECACSLCSAVAIAVARAMGWPRKP